MAATRLLPVLVLAVFVLIGTYAVSGAYETSGETIENTESFTPSAGSITSLDGSNLDSVTYENAVRVTYGNNDAKLAVDGDDYVWFSNNGTIKTVAGGALDGENTATIEYRYFGPTDEQRALATLVAGEFEIARLLVLVGVVGAVVVAAARLGGV